MKKTLLVALSIFALLGLADSIYLANAEITDTQLTCNVAGLSGCNVVAQSEYSRILGIPLGVYGIAFYGLVILLTFAMVYKPSRKIFLANLAVAWVGFALSIVFTYEQFFLIKAICIYCMGSAVLTTLICIASTMFWRFAPAKQQPVNIPEM